MTWEGRNDYQEDSRDNINVNGIVYSLSNIAKARVLRIDLNVGTPEIFEEAQVRVLGQDHVYPMIAFGTLKKKSSFKIYAKAKGMDFQLANEISDQIGNYEEAVKNADGDDKDSIDIYDFVDKTYKDYIEQSKEYWGIISDKKKAPSAYLLYQGDIRKEIGLIKCKSESTKKEYITCVIDGAIAENYKFLKNDILKVDVVLLIDKVFKRIGIDHFDVNKLLELTENNDKVWALYANGFTVGMNQVEQDGSKNKCKRYKPHNISELTAFVAAIRPGFKSMYSKFEAREDFSYGLKALDDLIQTEQFPYSYMIYQENIMAVLHYAGFPMDKCYGIIKAIAKKHPEKVLPLKSQFLDGFKQKIIEDENLSTESAEKYSAEVWQIINDNVSYSFNCVSGSVKMYGKSLTIKEMYDQNAWSGGKALSMFNDGTIRENRIVGIYQSGIRQTYEVETESGCCIICTDNHKFPTPKGRKQLDQLSVGDLLYCKGDNIGVYLSPIKSISPHKIEMTYDVEMEAPAHTFVTDSGLVTSNSSHAYCVALDSLYQAWQKAEYPYEFYETLLQHYSDKGNKDKVSKLKKEMTIAFGIKEGDYKFRNDNRSFVSDKENHVIYPSLASIKNITQKCADSLYSIKDNTYRTFVELLYDLKKLKMSPRQIAILIKIDYFSEFGSPNHLLKIQNIFEKYYDAVQVKKLKLDEDGIPYECVKNHCLSETAKQFNKVDAKGFLSDYVYSMGILDTSVERKAFWKYQYVGFCDIVDSSLKGTVLVTDVNTKYSPRVTVYALANGNTLTVKVSKKLFAEQEIKSGDILVITDQKKRNKSRRTESGRYEQIPDEYEWWITKYFVKIREEPTK